MMLARDVMRTYANETGVSVDALLRKRGGRDVERCRVAVMWTARLVIESRDRRSYSALGRTFRRDHSTVIAAVRRADELRAADDEFRYLTDRVTAMVAAPRPTVGELKTEEQRGVGL